MSRTEGGVGGRLRAAAGLLTRRPALLLAGAMTTVLTLAGVVVVVAAWHVAGGLVFDLLATTGRYGTRSVSDRATLAAAVLRGGLTLGLCAVAALPLSVVATLVAAAADRVALDESGVLRSVRSDLGGLALAALLRTVARFGLWVLWTLLGVAVYLSVGTSLEAVGYALDLYTVVPWVATVAAVAAAGLVGWTGATALLWGPGAVGRAAGSDLRAGLRRARARPLSTVADSVVVTLLSLAPLVAGVGTVFLADDTGLGNDVVLLWAVAAALTVGVVTGSFRAAYRSVVLGLGRDGGPGRTVPDRDDHAPTVPLTRIAVAVVVVVAAALAGVAVRTADLRPVDAGGAPGPVAEDAPPDAVVERAVASVADRSRTVRLQYSSRRLYDNGSREPWDGSGQVVVLIDPVDRRFLGYRGVRLDDGWSEDAAYLEPTLGVRATVDGRAARAEGETAPARAGTLLSAGTDRPATPAYTMGADGQSGGLGETLSSSFLTDGVRTAAGTTGWTVVERTDDRIVYESTDPETVAVFARAAVGGDSTDLRSVRVAVDADTGHVAGATVRYTYDDTGDPGVVENRAEYTVDGVGETDPSPPGVDRPPLSVVMDALFY